MKTTEEIKKSVVDQLAWDSRVDASDIRVTAEGMAVTLDGTVPSYSARNAAENVAWSVIGVTGVENNLAVEFPQAFEAPNDAGVKSSVEQLLEWNTAVDESDITVAVNAGIVTLEGTTPTYWEKDRAEGIAQTAAGVLSVVNKLAVVPTEEITDQILAERIMDRISNNTVLGEEDVDVEVVDGRVTLSGVIPSWSEWRAIYNSVQNSIGVVSIEDKTRVEYGV